MSSTYVIDTKVENVVSLEHLSYEAAYMDETKDADMERTLSGGRSTPVCLSLAQELMGCSSEFSLCGVEVT